MADREPSPQEIEAIRLRGELLSRLEMEGAMEHAAHLRKCAETMTLQCYGCGDVQSVPTRCKRRWCPVCARILSAERSLKVSAYVRHFEHPLFITLTARNVDTLNPEAMRRLRRAWSKMRRSRLFGRVLGGVVTFEVTNTGNGWHPHLHAVIDCQWLGTWATRPRATDTKTMWQKLAARAGGELQDLWGKQLKKVGWPQHDLLPVVKVKRCTDEGIATEISKYCVKASDLIEYQGRAADLIDAIQGTRLVTRFGHCHGVKLEDVAGPQPERKGLPCQCAPGTGCWAPEARA